MKKRAVGDQGLTTSPLGLGCMEFTGAYGPAEEQESIMTVRRALDLGITLFDTADVYGPFIGERLLGRALAGRRNEAIVATKFGGAELAADGSVLGGASGRPDYVRLSVERSLRHLGVDHIDLYLQHRVDRTVPVEETFGALAEMIKEGKLRYLGLSEAAPSTIRRAHSVAPLSAVETEYSLFSRQVETNGVLATTRELGIGFIAYAPLGRGFLTGTIKSSGQIQATDLRAKFPRFDAANLKQNIHPLTRLKEVADEAGVTLPQLALGWLLGKTTDVIPLAGTRTVSHLEENAAAVAACLDEATLKAAEAAVPAAEVAGDRRAPADSDIEE